MAVAPFLLHQDHPHIHGEYIKLVGLTAVTPGSPPHTWGIRLSGKLLNSLVRITPTYMGNTNLGQMGVPVPEDHPHIHGEYDFLRERYVYSAGSPPHTWGIHNNTVHSPNRHRITPTYMGNTVVKETIKKYKGDHPHIHGEYSKQTD